jgi:uncharacterized membrane protein
MKRTFDFVAALALFTLFAQTVHAAVPVNVPDAGATSVLLGLALLGLASVRRFVR